MAVVMNPNIWRTLPEELQEIVVAHLPLKEIFRLQLLSKKWRDRIVTGNESLTFRKACAEYSPKLFAVVSKDDNEHGTFHIRAHDTKLNNWHTYDMKTSSIPDVAMNLEFSNMTATDGGLVCCVSRVHSHPPLVIIVCNPLTREMKALPAPNFLSMAQPDMVQLVMDRGTKVYEVIVAGFWKGPAGDSPAEFIAEVYNSQTGAWSDITHSVSDCVFGYRYSQQDPQALLRWSLVPMVLVCQEGLLLQLNNDPWHDPSRVRKYDLVKDQLFILETMEADNGGRAWADRLKSLCACSANVNRKRRRAQQGDLSEDFSWVEVHQHEIPSKIWDIEWGGSVR